MSSRLLRVNIKIECGRKPWKNGRLRQHENIRRRIWDQDDMVGDGSSVKGIRYRIHEEFRELLGE
jgi:hypothetical protein